MPDVGRLKIPKGDTGIVNIIVTSGSSDHFKG